MLSSIHPLGERGRQNNWMVTVGSFTIASTIVGAISGGLLGQVGSAVGSGIDHRILLAGTAVMAVAAGTLDLVRTRPLGTQRQVNESWIGHYRGWVYGGAFGAQLGTGVMTYVVTWGVYATFAAELLTTSPIGGALVGATFGFWKVDRTLGRRAYRSSIPTHRLSSADGRPRCPHPPCKRLGHGGSWCHWRNRVSDMSHLEKAGIKVDIPSGWEGAISGGGFRLLAHGAREPTVLHVGSFPLPPRRGSFGSGAVEKMRNQDIFIALLEYGEDSVGTPLFAAQGAPRELLPGDFDRNRLQHAIPGQSGLQYFFTEKDRAFCLYVVLGSHIDRADLVRAVNSLLETLEIS